MSMLNILKMLAGRSAFRALSALAFCAVLLTGCAGGVTNVSAFSPAAQVRPETIYVYAFESTPDQVKLDGGLLQKVKTQLDGESTMKKQADDALEVREQVADEIVKQLQSMGLHAVRADSPAPTDRNVLIVQGSFETIDAGNRRRRMLVGLGAGKSQVGTSVQVVYQPAGEIPRLVQSFDALPLSALASWKQRVWVPLPGMLRHRLWQAWVCMLCPRPNMPGCRQMRSGWPIPSRSKLRRLV